MNDIIECVLFCVWLLSHRIMPLRFIHVATFIVSSISLYIDIPPWLWYILSGFWSIVNTFLECSALDFFWDKSTGYDNFMIKWLLMWAFCFFLGYFAFSPFWSHLPCHLIGRKSSTFGTCSGSQGRKHCSITYLISYNWQKSGGHLTGVWAFSCFALLPGGGGSGQGPDPNPVYHSICEGLPAAAVVEGWGMRKSREKSALLALLLQILYLFFCHTVGCPRDLGLIKEKDMTMKDRFF